MNFVQTNPDSSSEKCILSKQTAPSETIKHQRDKQNTLFIALIFNYLTHLKTANILPR